MKLAHDVDFLDRVQYELVTQALAVRNEDPGTAGHARRSAFAGDVLSSPASYAAVMAIGIVSNINLQDTVTVDPQTGKATTSVNDAALFATVASLWNAYAGA
jgi:hypothetical protein